MKRLLNVLRNYKLFFFALASLIAGLILSLLHLQTAAHWVLGSAAVISAFPILWDMVERLRSGTYGIDLLALTAIIASVWLHQYWTAIVIVLMLSGGTALERYAEHRARRELRALLARAPQQAHVIRKNKQLDIAATAVQVGDKILVKPSEIVPVDAVVIEGTSDFDESSLTGESLPQTRAVGDVIMSGSINGSSPITATAQATSHDSQYQQIVRLVRHAGVNQSPFVHLADRYSLPFIVASFAIAIAVWALSGQAIRFLEVIVVATPCPLLLAAPIALISGMSRASKYGILVKTGSSLERLAELETIIFDKTGTLTEGRLSVSGIQTFHGYKQAEVLSAAASLEQASHHVIAAALVQAANKQAVAITKAKHVQETPGRGLAASLKGRQVLVGRLQLLTDNEVLMPKTFKPAAIHETAVFVAIGGELAGVITLSDTLRAEAVTTLERLKRMKIRHFALVTGDTKTAAAEVAKAVGIKEIYAETMPADKLRALDDIKKRPLAFVGDGVNDAPVLTAADIGIAMGARGSSAASESADVVILQDDLGRVATAVAIAKRTFSIARQSILIGIGLSLMLMGVYATGKFSPLSGAIVQEVVDVVVIFNALRAHLGRGE